MPRRYSGETNQEVIGLLEQTFGTIAHIKWGVHEDTAEVTRLKTELAAYQRTVAELMRTNKALTHAPGHAPGHATVANIAGRSFSTYERKIGGISYEFSDDFKPDTVPAHQWDANLLLKYLSKNRREPGCVFPRLVSILSCTPRFDTNCDFGVVFEHPKTREDVTLEMPKAFATLCDKYRLAARAYQTFTEGEAGCGH